MILRVITKTLWFIKLEKDILVFNTVTKFHKGCDQDQTLSKVVYFHEQRAITHECMVRYGPLSNLEDVMVLNNVTKVLSNSDQNSLT